MPKKILRKYSASSGQRATRERKRRIKRLKMKVARWEKNRTANKPVSEKTKSRYPNRYNNWDTSGLKKQIAFLEGLV
jgi:hypothetical protein